MFKEKMTLVIGAGAGVDIDMPTGAKLIDDISKRLNFFFEGQQLKSGSAAVVQALRIAAKREEMDLNKLFAAARSISIGARQMRSIDSYIHAHSHDEAIKICGKIAIVEAILDYEKRCAAFIDTTKRPLKYRSEKKIIDSWVDQFMHLLMQGVVVTKNLDEIFNNLAIINFNYDRCLEQIICKALMDTFGITQQRAAELISKLLMHHPYGKIAPLAWQTDDGSGIPLGGNPYGEDDIAQYAKHIRTFNEEVKESPNLRAVRLFLRESPRIVFLGFHFHAQNVALIGLPESDTRLTIYRAYVSTYGRKEPEKEKIELQVRSLVRGLADTCVYMDIAECKELLLSYGTTLTS